jgi:enoyl-CoA hydratase/carnithine racemase
VAATTWTLDISDKIARITFTGDRDAPVALAHAAELADHLGAMDHSRGAASLVLITGGDGHFVPDIDRDELERLADGEPVEGDSQAWHRVISVMESLPQPTVAAIDGEARGAGCLIALACTFRLATERSVIGPIEVNLGVVGTDSASYLVPLVGPSLATELLLTERGLPAARAQQVGLLNDVFPPDRFADQVREWCQLITAQPATTVFGVRRAVADLTSVTRLDLYNAQPPGSPGIDQLFVALQKPCGCSDAHRFSHTPGP